MRDVVVLVVLVSSVSVGCRPPVPVVKTSDPKGAEKPAAVESKPVRPQPVASIPTVATVIQESSAADVEARLRVTIVLPDEAGQKTFDLPLRRGPRSGGASSEHSFAADRLAEDGKGFFSSTGQIRLNSVSKDALGIYISVRWTTPGQASASVSGSVEVPWLGAVDREIGSGVRVSATMKLAAEAARP